MKTKKYTTWADRILACIAWFFSLLPRRWSLICGRVLGLVLYIIFPYRKDVARSNLQRAFPEYSPQKRRSVLRRTYQHFGIMLVDFLRIPLLTQENLSSIIEFDEEHVPFTGDKGQGTLIMTAHIGNWELTVPVLVRLGYSVTALIVPQRGAGGTQIQYIRDSTGGQFISKRTSTRTMLRLLKDGNSLAILGDQDSRKSGVWVNFFAQSSSRPRGAAVFAMHTGAPLVTTWCILQKDYRYRMEFSQIPTDNLPSDREQAVRELTQRYITSVEEVVRRYPEQYFWFHRMWKTKPKDI